MRISNNQIKKILRAANYVTDEDIKIAEQNVGPDGSLVTYFLEKGMLTRDLIGQAVAEVFDLPYADLNSRQPGAATLKRISEDIARHHRIIPFSRRGDTLTFATDNLEGIESSRVALTELFPDKKITFAYSLSDDIDATLIKYRPPLKTRFAEIIETGNRVAPEIVDEIFEDARTLRASDIHIEPRAHEVIVRFRVDGVLHETGRIPKEYFEMIINRIKVGARMRIDEHFAAQDGALQHELPGGSTMDMRVSVVPTLEGEKVVLRVLSTHVQGLTLADLGLSGTYETMLEQAARAPFGMILVTGPTGSGKTTTLYALLKMLNQPGVNITTIEDPAEYRMSGVNQIQVNEETNLTFAEGLRSIVRQDPDIILVGEIRDDETVEIAVNAALTGHLLFSTFHANDSATAIPRLLDMGIEPFLLASTLELVVGQRLVRTLCDTCRVSESKTHKELMDEYGSFVKTYLPESKYTLYTSKGCDECNDTGFNGRTAIFELIAVTPEMKELIMTSPSSDAVWELARRHGSRSLFEDGIDKVTAGHTTLEELLRVAEPPEGV